MVDMKKDEFRKFAKSSLKKEIKFSAKCKHYSVILNLKKIVKFYNYKRILLFSPTKFEPNVLLLRDKSSSSLELLVPFMENISFKMVKLRLPFHRSKFGIKETNNQNAFEKRIDLAVVPVVGVDGNLARIGHGKGYYDIFFSKLGYRPKVIFVGIKDMFIKDIVTLDYDIKCDIYLTPKKSYIRGRDDRDFVRLRSRCSGNWRRVSSR